MIGYVKKYGDFIKESTNETMLQLKSLYGEAESKQIVSWENLINEIKKTGTPLLNDLVIGLEYFLPIEGRGIDFFVAGKDENGDETVFIIESKQWNDDYIFKRDFSCSRSDEWLLHPQLQVYNHYLAFKKYLSIGKLFKKIQPILLINHASPKGIDRIIALCEDANAKKIPIYNSMNDLLDYVSRRLTHSSEISEVDFLSADYSPSIGVIDSMNAIIEREPPFVLTDEQETAVEKINKAIKDGKKIIRIFGSGGSGKTAILLNMFVSYLNPYSGYKPYFSPGAQNFKLYQDIYKDIENVFSSTYGIQRECKKGVIGENNILFIDEAQHNEAGVLSDFVKTGCVMVISYDDKQVINLKNNAIKELQKMEEREDFLAIELVDSIRFNGSKVFEQNIRDFLNGKTDFIKDELFDFRIRFSLDSLIKETMDLMKNNPNDTVAIMGLLSSDADDVIKESKGLLKIDWNQRIKGIPAETRWIPYVREKKYLDNLPIWIGTWWAPGLDFDHVVVIAGGDAKMTKDGFVGIAEKTKNYKMMDSVADIMDITISGEKPWERRKSLLDHFVKSSDESEKQEFERQFTFLLKDMYYIMLTRGRKSCYVYFVNNENTY